MINTALLLDFFIPTSNAFSVGIWSPVIFSRSPQLDEGFSGSISSRMAHYELNYFWLALMVNVLSLTWGNTSVHHWSVCHMNIILLEFVNIKLKQNRNSYHSINIMVISGISMSPSFLSLPDEGPVQVPSGGDDCAFANPLENRVAQSETRWAWL